MAWPITYVVYAGVPFWRVRFNRRLSPFDGTPAVKNQETSPPPPGLKVSQLLWNSQIMPGVQFIHTDRQNQTEIGLSSSVEQSVHSPLSFVSFTSEYIFMRVWCPSNGKVH